MDICMYVGMHVCMWVRVYANVTKPMLLLVLLKK